MICFVNSPASRSRPRTTGPFWHVCEEIRSHNDPSGKPYCPSPVSKYHFGIWEETMFDPLTYTVRKWLISTVTVSSANDEMYVAFKTDRLSFHHPAILRAYRMLREVTDYFQVGYTGLGRDEAVFLFAQQRAVFMTTGTWDARSLQQQAEGQFEVGIMDFPIPAPDDPVYGKRRQGPHLRAHSRRFPFGSHATRSTLRSRSTSCCSWHASRATRSSTASSAGFRSVRGAATPSFLKGFEPHLWGVYGCFNPTGLGGETWLKWMQVYSAFQVNELSLDDMVAEFEPYYKERGLMDFMEQQKDWRRAMHTHEQFLAGVRALALNAKTAGDANSWVKYLAITTERQIWPEIHHTRQLKLVTGALELPETGPYEYSDELWTGSVNI